MNNFILKTICIIIVSMLVPVTVGLKHEPDSVTAFDIMFFICKLDVDGHLIYNVTCIADEIVNESVLIHFYGSGTFTKFNEVDVHTELFIDHLSQGESGLFKTKDQVFRVVPILRRPIVPFFHGEAETIFHGYVVHTYITIMMAYCLQEDYSIHVYVT